MPARRKSSKSKKQTQPHHFTRDVVGLMLIALGVFALVSVFFTGVTGAFGEAVMDVLFGLFGVLAYVMPMILIVIGWLVMISWQVRVHGGKLGSVVSLLFLIISLLHLFYDGQIRAVFSGDPGYGEYLNLAFRYGVEKGGGTGVLGGLIVWPLNRLLGHVGAFIFVAAGLIGCVALLTRFSLGGAGRKVTEAAYAATASALTQAREKRRSAADDFEDVQEKPSRMKEKKVGRESAEEYPARESVNLYDEREPAGRERPENPDFDIYGQELDVPQKNGPYQAEDNARYVNERLSMPRRQLPNEQIRAVKGARRRPEPDIIDLSSGRKISPRTVRDDYGEQDPAHVTPFPMEPMDDDGLTTLEREEAYFGAPRGLHLEQAEERTRELLDEYDAVNPGNSSEAWNVSGDGDLLGENFLGYDEMGLPVHAPVEDEGITIPEDLPEIDEFGPEPELDLPEPSDKMIPLTAHRSTLANDGLSGIGINEESPALPPPPPPPPPYRRPQLDLLSRPVNTEAADMRARYEQEERASLLLSTLKSFGIGASVVGISRGPTLTRYELKPEAGIKVSRIVSLSDDIAMNMAAAGVRIEAPIPGKAAIGIEVPNLETFPVALREVLTSDEFQNHKSRLAIAFGMDITGKPVVGDLADMPHLLIAGATGSGKSVCINSLVTSILYKSSPEEVKLIMVDPKVVELSVYNGIPHLLIPVVTDPKKAAGALHWAVQEMESRYKKFAATNSRDLKGYNAYAKANGLETIYQLVVIVDELADLMIVASREVEEHINRLAQLARAAGIHLVIATQRPSVNVITGVIKANIPSRIAFAVASQVDSRTILDMAGAEKLLGRGDMLFHPRGASKPRRVQGCLITDAEVHRVVDVVKRTNGEVLYNPDVIATLERLDAPAGEAPAQDDEDGDDLLRQAIELALDAGQVSASMLQRRYRIGYARAGRLIDEMEQRGIISGHEGSKPREVLLTREEFNRMYMQ